VTSELRQSVYHDYERKMGIMAEEGSWPVRHPGVILPADWVEADEHLSRLHARVFDDELQEQLEHFRMVCGHAMTAQDQATADSWTLQASTRLDDINARIGVLLNRLF
jgi:hypothetical protein